MEPLIVLGACCAPLAAGALGVMALGRGEEIKSSRIVRALSAVRSLGKRREVRKKRRVHG